MYGLYWIGLFLHMRIFYLWLQDKIQTLGIWQPIIVRKEKTQLPIVACFKYAS